MNATDFVNIDTDPYLQYEQYQIPMVDPATINQTFIGSSPVTTINGGGGGSANGPNVTFSGGTTGLTFTGAGNTITVSGTLVVANGGTGSTTAAGARTNLGAAASGANTDITSLTPNSITIGGGTAVTKVRAFSPNLTPSSVAANTTVEEDFTVSGLTTADKVIVNGPAPTAGTGIVNARVKAADTLTLTWLNTTAGPLTPTSGIYEVIAIRT